jgi:hypothetical protein
MSLYSIALFVHIVGALLLFGLLTLEGAALRLHFAFAPVGRVLGPISAVAILVPGLYMTATQWGWKAWILTGLASYVLIAIAGAISGVRVMRGQMNQGAAVISWLARIGIALGVVFVMTVKPDWPLAVTAVLVGAVLGAAAGALRARRTQSA